MRIALPYALFVAIAATGACGGAQVSPDKQERPAPPDRLMVTTKAGARFSGPAARIDIRHVNQSQPPDVEVAVSASGTGGRTWAMQATPRPDFLRTFTLSADVIDRPLQPGYAGVQAASPDGDTSLASSGLVQLRLEGGRIAGEVVSNDERFAATFEGPFVVTCAVPAGATAPQSSATETPVLVVDETFESPLCKPYAALAGGRR
jgi:hypothetical protein